MLFLDIENLILNPQICLYLLKVFQIILKLIQTLPANTFQIKLDL